MAETNVTVDTIVAQAIAAGAPQALFTPQAILALRNMLPWLLQLQLVTGVFFFLEPFTPAAIPYPRMLKRTVGGVLQTLIVTDLASDQAAQLGGWTT